MVPEVEDQFGKNLLISSTLNCWCLHIVPGIATPQEKSVTFIRKKMPQGLLIKINFDATFLFIFSLMPLFHFKQTNTFSFAELPALQPSSRPA